jgi:hypothetical protein
MTRADLICWLGIAAIGCGASAAGWGFYLIHPAAALLWGGGAGLCVGMAAIAVGVRSQLTRKDKPQ